MNRDALLLNINAVGFDKMVCQTSIQTEADKERLLAKGYNTLLTESEFRSKFEVDPSCIWYTPSISLSSFYFNEETLAAAPFHMELLACNLYPADSFYRAIKEREAEVSQKDYYGSLSTLMDGMRMEYFKRLIEQKGTDIPGLYDLFFSSYIHSDYGFGDIDAHTLFAVLSSKTEADKEKTAEKLKDLPDTVKIYRGGNSASTPLDKAYSWSLDINVANFFACRRGMGEGYIAEAEVSKEDIIDVFLDDRNEQEVVVDPKAVQIINMTSVKGLDFIGPILPELAPMYHKYLEQMSKLDFAQQSDAHGHDHQARVLLMCLTLSHLLHLPESQQRILATAAIYHDTQRTNDLTDPSHGKASMEYYKASVSNPDPLVSFLCEYHCLPDEAAYQEIRNNRQLSKNRSKATLLFNVFKDADALDRVRFGLKDLDLNQLRVPISKELSLAARLYLEQVQVPERFKKRKPSLSSRIQNASHRTCTTQSGPVSKERITEAER